MLTIFKSAVGKGVERGGGNGPLPIFGKMERSVFLTDSWSRFAIVVFDSVLGPPCFPLWHPWECPGFSAIPKAMHEASSLANFEKYPIGEFVEIEMRPLLTKIDAEFSSKLR